jgi:hypothetical protein
MDGLVILCRRFSTQSGLENNNGDGRDELHTISTPAHLEDVTAEQWV